jgi:hypothetical protein
LNGCLEKLRRIVVDFPDSVCSYAAAHKTASLKILKYEIAVIDRHDTK